MKTSVFIIALAAFSALMLSPKPLEEYPPKAVLEQRKEIVTKEIKINKLINTIEYALAIDSLQIENTIHEQ
jgi:hypothetical protein